MLRKRLLTVLTFNDGVLFRTKLFRPDYRYTLNFVDAWSVDEIVVLEAGRIVARGDHDTVFMQSGTYRTIVEHGRLDGGPQPPRRADVA